MSAITTPKKVFEYKLKHPLDFKYASMEELGRGSNYKINNSLEINIYDGPYDKTPALTHISERDKIACDYVRKVLNELKEELLVDLRKEYPDCGEKYFTDTAYIANFETPLIKNKICDKVIITVIHEDIDKNSSNTRITRYLDVVLM